MSPDSFIGGLNGESDRKTQDMDDKLNSYVPDPADFVSSLIKNYLINEYHLFINPAAFGKELEIFGKSENNFRLNLVTSTVYECGIVENIYVP